MLSGNDATCKINLSLVICIKVKIESFVKNNFVIVKVFIHLNSDIQKLFLFIQFTIPWKYTLDLKHTFFCPNATSFFYENIFFQFGNYLHDKKILSDIPPDLFYKI